MNAWIGCGTVPSRYQQNWRRARSKTARFAEGAHDCDGVPLVDIDLRIQVSNVRSRDFAAKFSEGGAQSRKFREGIVADNGHRVVGREIVLIVGQRNKMQGFDGPVGGVARDDVDLPADECAVDQPEIENRRRSGETKIVSFCKAREAIGPFQKFVADTDAPFWCKRRDVREFLEVEVLRIIAADNHSESVFETEGFGDGQMEAVGIELFHSLICGGGVIVLWGFVEHRCERGAGIFDVKVERAGEQSLVKQQGTTEIGFAVDVNFRARLDVLSQEFGEDDLFGEKLGADRNFRSGRMLATEEHESCGRENSEEASAHEGFSVSRESAGSASKGDAP
jgi:hypothetical protein